MLATTFTCPNFGHVIVATQVANASQTHRSSVYLIFHNVVVHRFKFEVNTDSHAAPSRIRGVLGASRVQVNNGDELTQFPLDLADEVKGMYRLMDLISESGSNGYGGDPSGTALLVSIR